MKTELSSLELHYLMKEFQSLINAKVEQIYQSGIEEFIFQFHIPNKGKTFLRIKMGKLIYLASSKGEVPEKPPNFCLYLRRKLKNSRLRSVTQEGFERVINILFETKDAKWLLHIELFSKGNLIFCNEEDTVLSAIEYQEFKDRKIKPKQTYEPPKKDANFLTISKDGLKSLLLSSEKENLVKTLAIELSLGGVFSEYLCKIIDVDKSVKANSLSDDEVTALWDACTSLKDKVLDPIVKGSEVLPFKLEKSDVSEKKFPSFNDALDSVLTKHVDTKKIESAKKDSKTQTDRINDIINTQTLRVKGLEKSEKENQRKGEIIYENYQVVEQLLSQLKELREKHSWKEIKVMFKSHPIIKSIDEKTGEISIKL